MQPADISATCKFSTADVTLTAEGTREDGCEFMARRERRSDTWPTVAPSAVNWGFQSGMIGFQVNFRGYASGPRVDEVRR